MKNRIIIVLLFMLFAFAPNVFAAQSNQPYFRVRYEIPKMPKEVYSKEAAAKNLSIYKQHLQKNKNLMAEKTRQAQAREAFVKNHNEITVNLLKDDRREYMRFNSAKLSQPIVVTLFPTGNTGTGSGVKFSTVDISRAGIGGYSKILKVNDEVPVKIRYGKTEIKTNLKIVSSNNGRVGGKFIKVDDITNDKLLYLSSVLESDSGLLKTKLAPM